MGIYDRPYMREPGRPAPPPPARPPPPRPSDAPWWSRLRFRLWLLLHPRHAGQDARKGPP